MIKREIKRYENGMTHIHYNVPFLNTMCINFLIGTGGLDEIDEKQFGISHFLEHMLFNGSEGYPDDAQTLKDVSGRGMYQNAWTWTANTNYYLATPVNQFDFAFDVLFERVYKPLLKGESVKKETGVIQEEINMVHSIPSEVLAKPIFEKHFEGSAYGNFIIGTKESVAGMTKEGLREYHKAYYSPGNSLCITYGGIDYETVEKTASEKLASLEPQAPITHNSKLNKPRKPNDGFVGDTYTTYADFDVPYYLFVKHVDAPKKLEEYVKYIVLESIVANGQGSIIDLELVTREPLVSSADVGFIIFRDCLIANAEFSYELEQKERFVEKLGKIFTNLDEYITEENFKRGLEFSLGQLIRGLEDVTFFANPTLVNIEMYNEFTGNDYSIEDLINAIKEVKIQEIKELAKTAFTGESTEGYLYPLSMKP